MAEVISSSFLFDLQRLSIRILDMFNRHPRQAPGGQIHQNISNGLKVIPSACLMATMGIYATISSGASK